MDRAGPRVARVFLDAAGKQVAAVEVVGAGADEDAGDEPAQRRDDASPAHRIPLRDPV
jgi:hypothetical protein